MEDSTGNDGIPEGINKDNNTGKSGVIPTVVDTAALIAAIKPSLMDVIISSVREMVQADRDSQETQAYNKTKENWDPNADAISVHPGSSLTSSPSKASVPNFPSDDMLSRSSHSYETVEEEPARKKIKLHSDLHASPHTGVNREEHCIAGVNRRQSIVGATHNDHHLDMVEETLRACEENTEFVEEYNPSIDDKLASAVIKHFKRGADHSANRSKLFIKHKLAANLAELNVPKVNPGVLNLPDVKQYHQRNETKLFDCQQTVTRATMAVAKVADIVFEKEKMSKVVTPAEVVSPCLEAIALLGHASRELSNRRKYNLKYCVDNKMKELCSPDKPTTQWLLGDDIGKEISEAKLMSQLRKSTPKKPTNTTEKSAGRGGYSSHTSSKPKSGNSNKPSFLDKGEKPKKGK